MRRLWPVAAALVVGGLCGWVLHAPRRQAAAVPPGMVPEAVRVDYPARREGPGEWAVEARELVVLGTQDPDGPGPVARVDGPVPAGGKVWRLVLTYPGGRRLAVLAGERE